MRTIIGDEKCSPFVSRVLGSLQSLSILKISWLTADGNEEFFQVNRTYKDLSKLQTSIAFQA